MTSSWLADKIEQWPTAKLVPYARNARTHSDAQAPGQFVHALQRLVQTAAVFVGLHDDYKDRKSVV